MDQTSRDRSFGGLLKILRRRRLVVIAMTVLGVAVGLALSLPQPKTYTAQAILLFQDPNQDLSLTGTASGIFRTAQQQAQIGADTLVTPRLARRVRTRLHRRLTAQQIQDDLSATADPTSSQVFLKAKASTGALAADLANAAAHVGARLQAESARARYATAARRIEGRLKALGTKPESLSQRIIYNEQITRLRTLSTLAQPVVVSKPATVPSSPTSPRPVQDGILGGILGLILGLVIAAVLEAFHQRLSSISDVEEELELPVLAHVGEEAMGRAGLSTSGLGPLSQPELEAFRILRTNLRVQNLDRPLKVVLVTSPMPEEGKSTVAASLAFSYAMSGRRTLLMECDFRRPSLAERLGLPTDPGLIDYLAGEAEIEDVVHTVPDAPRQPGANGSGPRPRAAAPLSAIVSGHSHAGQAAELFETSAFAQSIARLSGSYDAIIIDTPPLLPVADTLELLPHVDAVLLCVRSRRTTRRQASAGKLSLDPVSDRVEGVVVTGVSRRERGYYGYYGYYGYQYSSSETSEGNGAPEEEPKPARRRRIRLGRG